MVSNFVLLELRHLGLPHTAVMSLAQTWASTIHNVKTVYGISDTTYQNSKEVPLFGPGQGSMLGPFLWLLLFTLIVNSILPDTPSITLSSADKSVSMSDSGRGIR